MASKDSHNYDLIDQLADDFAARYRRGERPSLQEYIDRYPDLAEEIRELLPAMAQIEQVKADFRPLEPPAEPLTHLGDYHILRELGRGGMGVVYEAEQLSLGRRVALKVLSSQSVGDARHQRRFEREAKAAARLHHTNIVPVFEVGQEGATCYYAMQLIQGQSLDQIVKELHQLRLARSCPADKEHLSSFLSGGEQARKGSPRDVHLPALSRVAQSLLTGKFELQPLESGTPRPSQPGTPAGVVTLAECGVSRAPTADTEVPAVTLTTTPSVVLPGQAEFTSAQASHRHYFRSVARVGQQTAEALAYAHARGIVHRDIKPSNLLLDLSGVVWITDFGLAKTEDDSLTRTGEVLGTLRYMSPERFQGQCDVRADIYALGLTLYEMLVLKPAFEAPDQMQLVGQIGLVEPERPRAVDAQVPRDLETIVLKAIEKNPRRRYQTADELGEDLRRFLADEPILARRIRLPERLARWCFRNRALALLTVAVFILLAAVATSASVGYVQTALALKREAEERQTAERERETARISSARAQAEADWSGRVAYDADMQLAAQFWESPTGSARAVLDLLEAHQPQAGKKDLRDFAWHYQWRLCNDPLTLADHQGPPLVALAVEGHLVTFDNAYLVRRWDRARRSVVGEWRLPTLPDVGYHVDLSPDGTLLAVGTTLGKVSLYDTRTGRDRPFVEGGAAVSGLSFAPDGQTLAIVSADRKVQVWEVRDRKPRAPFALQSSSAGQCVLGPGGEMLLLLGEPDSAHVSLFRAGREGPLVRGLTSSLGSVACSPDGQRFVAGDGIEVRLWDAITGKDVARFPSPPGGVYAMAFSPDGTRLGLGGQEGLVTVWDLTSQQPILRLKGHTARVTRLRFAADGKSLVSSAIDGTAKLWEFATLEESRSLVQPGRGPTPWLAFSPDGRWLAVAGRPTQLWDARTEQPIRPFASAVRVAFSPDSKTLALGDGDGRVHLCDVATSRVLHTWECRPGERIAFRKMVGSLAFSPDGKRVVAGLGWAQWWEADHEQFVKVWDVATGQEVQTLPHKNTVPALAFSRDGTLLATASHEGLVRLWSGEPWQEVRTLKGSDAIDSVAIAPGGDLLATGGNDCTIRLWEPSSGQLLRSLQGHSYTVFTLAFSPDGKTLASASWDRTIKLWDVVSGRELRTLAGHSGWIHGLAYSPDGKMLASCDQSGGVRMWDTRTRWQRAEQATNSLSRKQE
jgi:WD40 repeat protein/serine/threonine protein kinase